MFTKIWERAIIEKLKKPSPIVPIRWRETRNAFPIIHWALSNRPKIPEISVGTSNGTDRFGLLRPEFEGAWSTLTGRNEMFLSIWLNCCPPYRSFVSCLQIRTITKRVVAWVGSVQPESQYRSIGHVEFPKLNFKPEFCSIESAHLVRRG